MSTEKQYGLKEYIRAQWSLFRRATVTLRAVIIAGVIVSLPLKFNEAIQYVETVKHDFSWSYYHAKAAGELAAQGYAAVEDKYVDVVDWANRNVEWPNQFPMPTQDPNKDIYGGFATSGYTGMPNFHVGSGTVQTRSGAGGPGVITGWGNVQSGPATVSGSFSVG